MVYFNKIMPMKRMLAILFVFCGLSACKAGENTAMLLPLDTSPLIIKTTSGSVSFNIEIADEPIERQRGLMFRERLPDGQGMLFVFEDVDLHTFWMKNTPQPLDIIFIGQDRLISSIQKGEPLSTATIPSGAPARSVLELAYGEAARLGIKRGDRVEHPALMVAPKF
jgi:uncharacterized protein